MPFSVVIPAYNEERTVERVVDTALKAYPLVREVVVVDDGSVDDTASRASAAGASVIRLPHNSGKTLALLRGVQRVEEDLLLLLDADLLGLEPYHLDLLAAPVYRYEAAMTIGVFRGARPVTDMAQALMPQLSGQRALSRELFLAGLRSDVPGFAAEVALNAYARRLGLVVTKVGLPGVTHLTKEEKRGVWPGFKARMRMYLDIWQGFS